jgi:hypothetical protein
MTIPGKLEIKDAVAGGGLGEGAVTKIVKITV